MSHTTRASVIRLLTFSLLALFAASDAFAQTKAYVTNEASGTVSLIDTKTNTVTASVPVGLAPFGVAVTPDDASRTYRRVRTFSQESTSVRTGLWPM